MAELQKKHAESHKPHKRSLSIHEGLLEKIRSEFKGMNVAAMRQFINSLGPQEEMYAGRQLLNRILDINKASNA